MFLRLVALHVIGKTIAGNQEPHLLHVTYALAISYLSVLTEDEICDVSGRFSVSGRPSLEQASLMKQSRISH